MTSSAPASPGPEAASAFRPGLEGVPATQSAICDIDGRKGVLTYRRDKLLRQVSNVQVLSSTEAAVQARAKLVVYQSSEEGVSSLYMVARYELELLRRAQTFKVGRMAVVVDSFGIDTMLAVPL